MNNTPDIKRILKNQKLAPSKKRGQNFLRNPQTAASIVRKAGVNKNDTVLELGVGLGALTIPLAAQTLKVIGIEIDRGIIEWHRTEKTLPDNVELLHLDLLAADYHKISNHLGCRLKILANLPYSISNPLLFKLIENRDVVESATLMLQKEVGERLSAGPGRKDYGILSVLASACAETEILMHVGPGNFYPVPKVDSVVVKMVFHPVSRRIRELPAYDFEHLKKIVKSAFQQRRKTLHNSLRSSGINGTGHDNLIEVFVKSGIEPMVRPERLTVQEFIRLSNTILAKASYPVK